MTTEAVGADRLRREDAAKLCVELRVASGRAARLLEHFRSATPAPLPAGGDEVDGHEDLIARLLDIPIRPGSDFVDPICEQAAKTIKELVQMARSARLPTPLQGEAQVEPVAWLVERHGTLVLPLLRSRHEHDRYQQGNPGEKLVALYASPSPPALGEGSAAARWLPTPR